MAAETIQHRVPSPRSKARTESERRSGEGEKKSISVPEPPPRLPTPPDIVKNRELRRKSIPKQKLTIDDFELLKTLGTGAYGLRLIEFLFQRLICDVGTFARVWLVRWKGAKEGESPVFALKVLRKADGE